MTLYFVFYFLFDWVWFMINYIPDLSIINFTLLLITNLFFILFDLHHQLMILFKGINFWIKLCFDFWTIRIFYLLIYKIYKHLDFLLSKQKTQNGNVHICRLKRLCWRCYSWLQILLLHWCSVYTNQKLLQPRIT